MGDVIADGSGRDFSVLRLRAAPLSCFERSGVLYADGGGICLSYHAIAGYRATWMHGYSYLSCMYVSLHHGSLPLLSLLASSLAIY